jgi:hypothetical protein
VAIFTSGDRPSLCARRANRRTSKVANSEHLALADKWSASAKSSPLLCHFKESMTRDHSSILTFGKPARFFVTLPRQQLRNMLAKLENSTLKIST